MTGYKKIKRSDGSTIDEHRIVAGVENSGPGVVVHHMDGDKRNNHVSNLMILSRSDHSKMHGLGTRIRPNAMFAPTSDGTGTCRFCKTEKPWNEFRTNRTWSNGKASICKDCGNNSKRKRRKATAE